jgi:hypothetical protein
MTRYQGAPFGIYAIAEAISVFDLVIELVEGMAKLDERGLQNSYQYVQLGYILAGYSEF